MLQGAKQKVLKTAFVETVYMEWKCRNAKLVEDTQVGLETWKTICQIVATVCEPFLRLNMFFKSLDGRVQCCSNVMLNLCMGPGADCTLVFFFFGNNENPSKFGNIL